MHLKLVAWARAVKSRRRWDARRLPPLWLFTDAARMADAAAAVGRLPKGLCGVVFRHDGVPGRLALARTVARLCRQRRLVMVVAGERIPLPCAGVHLREGRGTMVRGPMNTSSAHGMPGLVRARRRGVAAVFLSPALPTASHPRARGLGIPRWAALARRSGVPVLALGGIDGGTAVSLPRWTAGAGAIGALLQA